MLSEPEIIQEKIVERKIIVYKSRFELKAIRLAAEKMKTKLFPKFVFMRRKPEEIRIVSIDKYYEPYIIVDGEYTIDFSKEWANTIEVDETMQELTLFDRTLRPKLLKNFPEIPQKVIELVGEGRFRYQNKAHIIFNRWWQEVELEQLPYVPFEEQPERVLNDYEGKFGDVEIPIEKETEILRSKIVRRPKHITSVHEEQFEISDRAVIFKPMYNVIFQNIKTGEELTVTFDAVTGQTYK